MARKLKPSEVQASLTSSMGAELGGIFYRLWCECSWLHVVWRDYVALFDANEGDVTTLREAAPAFARVLRATMWEALVLQLCRISDPASNGKKQNLTIRRLSVLVKPELQKRVDTAVADLVGKTEFARNWRNRYIAHRDLEVAFGISAEPLPSFSKAELAAALSSLAGILNLIEVEYCNSVISYKDVLVSGDAAQLAAVLRSGLEARAVRPGFVSPAL